VPVITCRTCGIEFKIPPCRSQTARYCSNKCKGLAHRGDQHPGWKPKAKFACETCGKAFEAVPWYEGKRRFCSTRCNSNQHKGRNNVNWKGGVTPKAERIRKSIDYKEWRGAVFARDNWTCQDCGQRGGQLHAHHIFPFSQFAEHQFEVWNGVTLCIACHAKIHPILRRDTIREVPKGMTQCAGAQASQKDNRL